MNALAMDRRRFLAVGSGIVVSFALGAGASPALAADSPPWGSLAKTPMLDAWLKIGADGTVTVMTDKVEYGQGISTAIAQIAADELDIEFSRVRIICGDTALTPDEGRTVSSKSIEDSGQAVRYAAAEAREILIDLAATELAVPAGMLRLRDGRIEAANGRSTTYWELADRNPLHRPASLKGSVKPRDQRSLIGKSVPRLDFPDKFGGVPIYLQDMNLPGMLHGRVVRPPAPDMQLLKLDEEAARALKGVIAIVRLGTFLGVIADREETAIAAADALRAGASWSDKPQWPFDDGNVSEQLLTLPANINELAKQTAVVEVQRRLKAVYSKPFIAHASMGPSASIAHLENDRFTVWSHTQGVHPLRKALAKVLKVAPEAVHVKYAQGPGGYGHNGADDVALDAALLARAVPGRPVRVQWMRDDEFAWEPYGSAMTMQIDCGLDKSGALVDWQYDYWTGTHSERPNSPAGDPNLIAAWHLPEPYPRPAEGITGPLPAGAGSRNAIPGAYAFPSHRITEHLIKRLPLRTSSLRCLGAYANIFAIESMMDEAAAATRQDPLAFRLKHMTDARAMRVLRTAAEAANWKPGKQGDGRHGRGIVFSRYKNVGAFVALIADVEVDLKSGTVSCRKITAAVDAGEVINPDGLKNQIEGGMIQGLSWTMKEQVRFAEGQIVSRTWNEYPILTFSEVPLIDLHIIDTGDEPPLGAGEPGVPPVAPAIANAVAAATGVRLRALPFTPERVLAAIAKRSR